MIRIKNEKYIVSCDVCGQDAPFGDTTKEGAWAIAGGFKWRLVSDALHLCANCQHITVGRR